MSKKIFVGNLSFKLKSEELEKMFSEFGEIEDVIIVSDKETNRSKGFGFVTFVNDADADKAISEMNKKEFDGREITVNAASEKEERPRKFSRHNEEEFDNSNRYYTTVGI